MHLASDFDFDVGNRIVILAIEWFSGKRIFFDNIIFFGNRIIRSARETFKTYSLGSATVAFVFGFVMSLYFYSESVRDILYL